MLQIKNLVKKYDDHLVLDIPDLALNPGIYWVKGSNGIGKTTLFKILAGLIPYEGEIWLNQKLELSQHVIQHRQLFNYGEAEPLYPSFLTGEELINVVASAKKAASSQVTDLVQRLQVEAFIYSPIGSYSSGMLKKLSLILAFLGNPAWIVLDEPLITLDTEAVKIVNELINEYYQTGISFLLSSHQDFINQDLPLTATLLLQNKRLFPQQVYTS